VRCCGIYFKAASFTNRFCCVDDGAGSINHVINQKDVFAVNITDNVHHFRNVGCRTTFVDNHQVCAELLCKFSGELDSADIRGGDDKVVAKLSVANMVDQNDA